MKRPTISPKVEVVARITLTSFVAYVLTLADIPNAVPPALAQLLGIFGTVFAVSLPHLVFILGAAIPSLMAAIVFGLGGATVLLCAATVSDGLFVTIFCFWTLWCTGLWYGPDAGSTASNTSALICAAGQLALGSWQLVQDGLKIIITEDPSWEEEGFFVDYIKAVLEKVCGDDANCWEEKISALSEPIEVTIPGSGPLGGQTAFLSFDNGKLTIAVPGGLWIVKGYWIWSGLGNPLAVMRNFLIVICWALACVSLGRLLPPIRTARKMFSRGVLPSAINDAVSFVKDTFEEVKDGQRDEDPSAVSEKEELEAKNTHMSSSIAGGGMAALTAYEPRVLRNPLECTWPTLKELVASIENLVLFALASELIKLDRDWTERQQQIAFAEKFQILNNSAAALLKDDENLVADSPNDQQPHTDCKDDVESSQSFSFRTFSHHTEQIRAGTVSWLTAMHHPKFTGWKNTAMSYAPWIFPTVVLLKRMVISLTLPFRPKTWDLSTSLICVKFTAGVTILVIMEVYWAEYRGFAINSETEVNDPSKPFIISLAESPNIFSGWNLLAYILATTPTIEGTVKKGTLRAIGTALGGFGGWLAVIVCSGSYDQDANVNLYGLVTWLTITTAIASYISIPDGPMAMMGLNADNGLYSLYFAQTQALIALEVALGVGERDTIVANRVVATASGVIMAMIVAIIPPHTRGADPAHSQEVLRVAQKGLADGLGFLLVDDKKTAQSELAQLRASVMSEGIDKNKYAKFLLKDATKLKKLPYFKVDPRLQKELESLNATGYYILGYLNFIKYFLGIEGMTLDDSQKERFQSEIKALLKCLEQATSDGEHESFPVAGEGKEVGSIVRATRDEPDLIIIMGRFLVKRLDQHETVLASIK